MIFCGNGEYFAFMLIDYKNCLLYAYCRIIYLN